MRSHKSVSTRATLAVTACLAASCCLARLNRKAEPSWMGSSCRASAELVMNWPAKRLAVRTPAAGMKRSFLIPETVTPTPRSSGGRRV